MKIYPFLLSLLFVACNSGVEIERIDSQNLVSVSSFISPQDSVVSVYIYKGQALESVVRLDSATIKNATVSITNNQRKVLLSYDKNRKCYVVSNNILKVTALNRYDLSVGLANGQLLQSWCVIPQSPAKSKIEGSKEGNDYNFSVSWPVTETNRYYSLSFDLADVKFTPRLGSTSGPYLPFGTGSQGYLFDRNSPNIAHESTIKEAFRADKVTLIVKYQALEPNTYQYLKTYADASNWKTNSDGIIPTFREPQPVFSNINGGVGIFGAYNQSLTRVVVL